MANFECVTPCKLEDEMANCLRDIGQLFALSMHALYFRYVVFPNFGCDQNRVQMLRCLTHFPVEIKEGVSEIGLFASVFVPNLEPNH